MDNSPGFQAGNAMWYMGLMLPASQNRLLQHLYCNNAARTKIFGILPQHARQSILARMKKVHKCPKCGMERRVAKRCRSRGTCKERDNSMSFPRVTSTLFSGCKSKETALLHCKERKQRKLHFFMAKEQERPW
jgi:hypothetical protein